MSQNNAAVEAKWLHEKILPEILKTNKFIRKCNKENFKILATEIKFIGGEEGFMSTNCYRALVAYENDDVPGKCSFVVKKTPELTQEAFDSINFGSLFDIEIVSYNKIIPAIEKFTGQPLTVPKCYYSDLQKCFATIILDDFTQHGWSMAKDKFNLSLPHLLLAAKYLGTFHGMGFAMRQCRPEEFKQLTSLLKKSRIAADFLPELALKMKHCIKRAMIVTRKYHSDVSEEFLQKLEALIGDSCRYGKKRVQLREPMVTLCHGDYLRNNVAYKYGKENDEPEDIMMFDLQTMRLASPMLDLSVFLALSAFKEVRHNNFKEIFKTYCNALQSSYELYAKTSIPDFLRPNTLLKEYVQFLPYSVTITAGFLMLLVEPDETPMSDFLKPQCSAQEIINDAMTRGGEVVNCEVAHQIWEMYTLTEQLNVDISEGCDN